ncbi:MAG: SdpI family protein [Polyangiales bacterium]
MKSKLSVFDRVALALIAAATAVTAGLYPRLPAQIPVHFDLYGRADGFLPKAVGAPLLIVIAAFVWAFVRYGARLLPASARERYEQSPMEVAGLLSAAFMVGLQFCVLSAALSDGAFGRGFAVLLGAFWVLMGLLFPRLRRNPFVGIRVRWTMQSDENWARTHRFAGQCFVLAGVVALLSAAAGSVALAIVAVLFSALVPVVYSWRMAK